MHTSDQIQAREQQLRFIEQGQFDVLVDAAFPGIVDPYHVADQDMLSTWRAMASMVGPGAFIRQQRAVISRSDPTALLPTITGPTPRLKVSPVSMTRLVMSLSVVSPLIRVVDPSRNSTSLLRDGTPWAPRAARWLERPPCGGPGSRRES